MSENLPGAGNYRSLSSGESVWVVDWVGNYSGWMIHQPLLAPFRNTIVSVEIYAVLDYSFAWSSLLGSFGSRSHTE
jgi:hypothetical protein